MQKCLLSPQYVPVLQGYTMLFRLNLLVLHTLAYYISPQYVYIKMLCKNVHHLPSMYYAVKNVEKHRNYVQLASTHPDARKFRLKAHIERSLHVGGGGGG